MNKKIILKIKTEKTEDKIFLTKVSKQKKVLTTILTFMMKLSKQRAMLKILLLMNEISFKKGLKKIVFKVVLSVKFTQ
jgi:hypothetical protein